MTISKIEALQLERYNHLEGDHFGRYGTGSNDMAMKRFKVKLIKEMFSDVKGAPILDLGADEGSVVGALSDNGNTGISIDIAYQRLLGNSRLGKGLFVCSRAQELPFSESSIGGICAFDIIEHLDKKDPVKMMEEIYRVLAPGKKVILATTNTSCLARNMRRLIEPDRVVSIAEHANEMSYQTVRQLFRQTGFVNIHARGAGIIPGMRRLQWFLPFNKLHKWDIAISERFPQISPEIFIAAEKPQ